MRVAAPVRGLDGARDGPLERGPPVARATASRTARARPSARQTGAAPAPAPRRADAAHKSATLAPRSLFRSGPGTVASHAICDVWDDGGDTAAIREFLGRFSRRMASTARAASAQATRA